MRPDSEAVELTGIAADDAAGRRRRRIGRTVVVLWTVLGACLVCLASGLLALSLDEAVRYDANIAEFGDEARWNRDESRLGIVFGAVLVLCIVASTTGICAWIASRRDLRVGRTALVVAGALLATPVALVLLALLAG